MSSLYKQAPIILFFLLFYLSKADIGIYQQTIPGKYLLTPKDYGYSSNIIVEIWGAGASGSCGYGYAGGSGAYIKAFIPTNNSTFSVEIGSGGESPICHSAISQYGSNGTSSSITSSNNKINVTVDGGKTLGDSIFIEQSAKILSSIGIEVFDGQEGQTSRYTLITKASCPCSGNGGSAYHGGLGGNGLSVSGGTYFCFLTNSGIGQGQINGENPGGGGGSTNCLDPKTISNGGSGGNGSIIIYYSI